MGQFCAVDDGKVGLYSGRGDITATAESIVTAVERCSGRVA
jgi:hypothetical protein